MACQPIRHACRRPVAHRATESPSYLRLFALSVFDRLFSLIYLCERELVPCRFWTPLRPSFEDFLRLLSFRFSRSSAVVNFFVMSDIVVANLTVFATTSVDAAAMLPTRHDLALDAALLIGFSLGMLLYGKYIPSASLVRLINPASLQVSFRQCSFPPSFFSFGGSATPIQSVYHSRLCGFSPLYR